MAENTTLIFLVIIQCLCQLIYGQQHYRSDYKYLPATDTYYKIHTTGKTWAEAKSTCEREGAILYYPEDEFEANVSLEYWKTAQPTIFWFWFGVSDLLSQGVFETVDGRIDSGVYLNWAQGEPNNANGNEDCVYTRPDGTINDYECSYPYAFMCKRKAASVEWNKDCDTYDENYNLNKQLGKCYKFHLKPTNWTEAHATCSAELSYLAIIDSATEAEYLANITALAPKNKIKGLHAADAVYLGFHDRFNDGWQTVKRTKLEDMVYVDWDAGQPDDTGLEQCGGMSYSGRLHDLDCGSRRFFICEHDVTSLQFSIVERVL